MKVIFHVDERSKWPLALGNVRNMLAYGETHQEVFTIEILANADAVLDGAKDSTYQVDMTTLLQAGVRIAFCQNALRANELSKEQLLSGIDVVPAGVVELALKQQEGYAYIKP